MKKIAIIGGGAAGLALAVMLKRRASQYSVTVFEALDRVGKKLATTGNGRCNITNFNLNKDRYHGDSDFAMSIIDEFDYIKQEKFFNSLGVLFVAPEDNRVYPKSLQAASVTDALRFSCADLGVEILTESKVQSVSKQQENFLVLVNGEKHKFDAVVVATGGCAGGKIATSDGYAILKGFGHKIEPCFPSIVQVKTETEMVRQLKGIKVDAKVNICCDNGENSAFGEVLFCEYGLSGPAVLQVSRLSNYPNAVITLDLIPDMTEEEVCNEILFRKNTFKNRIVTELFAGFINKKLGQAVTKYCKINQSALLSDISEQDVVKLAHTLKSWSFKVTGNTGFANAQVTAGGASTSQFFGNLMSKKVKGLFAVGEVLNVDGDCGGFNLAFAWSSANKAADGICEYFKTIKG